MTREPPSIPTHRPDTSQAQPITNLRQNLHIPSNTTTTANNTCVRLGGLRCGFVLQGRQPLPNVKGRTQAGRVTGAISILPPEPMSQKASGSTQHAECMRQQYAAETPEQAAAARRAKDAARARARRAAETPEQAAARRAKEAARARARRTAETPEQAAARKAKEAARAREQRAKAKTQKVTSHNLEILCFKKCKRNSTCFQPPLLTMGIHCMQETMVRPNPTKGNQTEGTMPETTVAPTRPTSTILV